MLTIVRFLLLGALGYGFYRADLNARLYPNSGDLMNAFWVAYCVIIGMFTAFAWAPAIGGKVADPLTGIYVADSTPERKNYLLRLIRWLDGHQRRRLTRWLCFLEGVRHPWMPSQFIIGLNNAKRGSWLELAYAREVYRFNNAKNCVQAYEVLRRHGKTVPPHANSEVNLMLASIEKPTRPPSPPLAVPTSQAPPMRRNLRIKLPERLETKSPVEPPTEDG